MYAANAKDQASLFETNEAQEASQAWTEFIAKASESSAAIAHKFSKVPLSIGSASVLGSPKSRDCLLQDQVETWAKHWEEDNVRPGPSFASVPVLPPILVDQVYKASRSFSKSTVSRSGFHPQHVSLLPPLAVQALITIFQLAEAVGTLPPQLDATSMALLPKPAGGCRTIRLYQALFRGWSKVRSSLTKQWERHHASIQGFAAGKNRSPVDVVWRQAFAAEAAQCSSSHYACVL